MNKTVNLIHLKNTPIYEQLQLEEALLRLDSGNWCILNEGAPHSIVMGISGKPESLINGKKVAESPIPLIKRYSGGGTVVVDGNTLFVSFIFQKDVHSFPLFPEPILRWSETFYKQVFQNPDFHLRENDYVIGEKKCGGNAQYIKKDRFVHHTTFLWDFEDKTMDYLLYPPKTPSYRKERSHRSFLCRLKDHFPKKTSLFEGVLRTLDEEYNIKKHDKNSLSPLLKQAHRKTTSYFSFPHK